MLTAMHCRVAWLALLAGIVAAGTARAAPPVQVRVNGVPFALQFRVIEGDPAVLAQRLEGRWGERLGAPGSPPATPAASTRQLLGRQRGPFHETLTLLAGPRAGSSYALVAVQDLRRRPAALPRPPLPLPTGSRLLNVVQFGDAPGASALFSAHCEDAPPRVLERLAETARAGGWQLVARAPSRREAGAAFWGRLGTRELSVVVTPAGSGTRLQMLHGAGVPERPW